MKRIMFLVLLSCILLFNGSACGEGEKIEAQKFAVTYTVKYNSLTLEEATEREILIKQRNKNACKVTIKVENLVENLIVFTTGTD